MLVAIGKNKRSIYTSDFRARFHIKLGNFREPKIIVCLVNLQAYCEIRLASK
jgi:hypothetical protein